MNEPGDPRRHRLLGALEVKSRTGLSRTTLWRLERANEFPARRQISPNRVGWFEHEVDAWVASCGF